MATSGKNTAPAESAQALFCALADYLGQDKIKLPKSLFDVNTYKTYPEFKLAWNNQYSKKRNSVEEIFKNHVDRKSTRLNSSH